VAIEVKLPGRGPLLNVLAATAVAIGFDVPLDAIAARAASLTAAPRRGEVTRLARGVLLVDDSYNSSPAALARALDAIGDERTAPRRVPSWARCASWASSRTASTPSRDAAQRPPASTCSSPWAARRRAVWRTPRSPRVVRVTRSVLRHE
jgi:hypothetical protein